MEAKVHVDGLVYELLGEGRKRADTQLSGPACNLLQTTLFSCALYALVRATQPAKILFKHACHRHHSASDNRMQSRTQNLWLSVCTSSHELVSRYANTDDATEEWRERKRRVER
eukprot:6211446-Pleurochrysis_carterae.AAC.6